MNEKIILLTGSSSGIGRATAELLMNKGAIVYGASRKGNQDKASKNGTGKIISVQMDVNNEIEIKSIVERIIQEQGKLDAVICNAGNGLAGSVEDSNSDEVKYQFETNFFGVVKTIQACLPTFRKQKYGKIINISSVAAIIPIPYQAYYSAVKSASMIFMQALQMEVKPFGIQCCSVLPGDTKTGFTSSRKYAENSEKTTSVYYSKMKKAVGKMEHDEQNGMPPEVIANAIVNQIYRKKMKAIVIPTLAMKIVCWLGLRLNTKFKIWLVGKIY